MKKAIAGPKFLATIVLFILLLFIGMAFGPKIWMTAEGFFGLFEKRCDETGISYKEYLSSLDVYVKLKNPKELARLAFELEDCFPEKEYELKFSEPEWDKIKDAKKDNPRK